MTTKNEKTDEGKRQENVSNKTETLDCNANSGLWGYDMYPERRGEKQERSWFKLLIGAAGRESIDKNRCEENVYKCVKDSTIFFYVMHILDGEEIY